MSQLENDSSQRHLYTYLRVRTVFSPIASAVDFLKVPLWSSRSSLRMTDLTSAREHNVFQRSTLKEHVSNMDWKVTLSRFVQAIVGRAVMQKDMISTSLSNNLMSRHSGTVEARKGSIAVSEETTQRDLSDIPFRMESSCSTSLDASRILNSSLEFWSATWGSEIAQTTNLRARASALL